MKILKIDHLGIAVNSIDEGKKFWTDAEKVAQSQDFVRIMRIAPDMDMEFETKGPGVVPHIWKVLKDQSLKVNFGQVFSG